jgi:polyhydroxybutyrate depolymerase
MMTLARAAVFCISFGWPLGVVAQSTPQAAPLSPTLSPKGDEAGSISRREWQMGEVTREALVHVPKDAKEKASPLIFVWHGHGGNMRNTVRSFHLHTLWPEALVVYAQGLNTPGRLSDPEGKKPGWQHGEGAMEDRDLKFFDAMLASLKSDYKVDEKRVFSTGHSNGGAFTYLLWATRGDLFAAMAPSAAPGSGVQAKLKPKPLLHIAGENDPTVKFAWQKVTIENVRKLNQCREGKAWDLDPNCTIYESEIGKPVITALHPGGHEFIPQAPEVIVKFFKWVGRE